MVHIMRRCRTYNMDRAYQLRAQHARRHRLILAIFFLVMLLFVCIIVALLLKYALGIGDERNDGLEDALRIEGSWGDWLAWSKCSVTCGGGLQSRRRFCDDPEPQNNGSHCDGLYEESRECAPWPCPDCSRYCEIGFLRHCAYCKCMGNSLRGRVTDMDSVPLYGVGVYVKNMQWEYLTRTGPQGKFTLINICKEELVLVFRKDGYRTAEVNATYVQGTDGYVSVSLEEIRQPSLIKYPLDTVAFEGETVILPCMSDIPRQAQYEWFKNGNILSHPNELPGMASLSTAHAPKLIIRNTQKGDSGRYRCRTMSDVGEKTFSKPAILKVVGREVQDTCNPNPLPKYVALPEGCWYENEERDFIDVGYCPPEVCRTRREEGSLATRKCCGVAETEIETITCDHWSFPITKTKSCGCITSCDTTYNIPVTGRMILRDPLYGTVKHLQTTFSHNGHVLYTDENGHFLLTVHSNETRSILSIPQIPFPDSSAPDIRVLHHPGPTDHFDIPLSSKASPVRIESSQTMEFPVMSVGMTSLPVASITLPGGTVMDNQWKRYNGTMDVYTAFLDPRLLENLEAVPGDFTYRNEEGEINHLEIFGVIIFYIENPDGIPLETNTDILVVIDAKELDIPRDRVDFWYLDHSTARWRRCNARISQGDPGSNSQRNMLQARIEINQGTRFIAVARSLPNRNRCEVKVSVYNDKNLTETVPGQLVKVLSKLNGNFIHKNQELTDLYGSVCIEVPCGQEHYLSVFGSHTTNFHNLPADFDHVKTEDKVWVIFDSPMASLIDSDVGPVHRLGGHTCQKIATDIQTYQFDFIKDNKEELPIVPSRGTLTIKEHTPGLINSWYDQPMDSPLISACAIKLTIQGPFNSTEIVTVSSRGILTPELYGSHVTRTFAPESLPSQMSEVCVLVKCPTGEGLNADNANDDQIVPTHVKIHIALDSSRECQITELVQTNHIEWSDQKQTRNHTLNLVISENLQFKPGVFYKSQGNGEATSDWALLECAKSKRSAVKLDCG